jgi:peptidoglycan/LPS O-acetylase OafA/YrhL
MTGGASTPNSFSRWLLARLSRETSSGRFIPEMDGLRFVAIAMVVLFHLNGYLTAKAVSPQYAFTAPSDWLAQVALVGFRGVELFFVISGFILGLPFAAHYIAGAPQVSLSKYYLRRVTRLEPPYFVTIFVLLLLAIAIQRKAVAALLPHLIASLCYMHNLIYAKPSTALGVAWSLEIEVQFYLLVPVLTLLFAVKRRWLRRCLLLAAMTGSLAAQTLYLPDHPRLALSILAYLQYFLAGFLLADIFLVEWEQSPRLSMGWDFAALAAWPVMFAVLRSATLSHWIFPYLLLVLYCAAFRGTWTNRLFSHPWITAIGGMCYSIYLIHYEVISAVARFTKPVSEGTPYWIHLLVQFVMVGSAVVFICGLYFVLLEKPCMRRDWPRALWTALSKRIPHKLVGETYAASDLRASLR